MSRAGFIFVWKATSGDGETGGNGSANLSCFALVSQEARQTSSEKP